MAYFVRRIVFSDILKVSLGNRFCSSKQEQNLPELEDPEECESDTEQAKNWEPYYAGPRDNPYMVPLEFPKSFNEMPGVPIFPFIGSAWSYLPKLGIYDASKQHIADREKFATFGPIVREKYGSNYLVLSFARKDLKAIITFEEDYPVRSEFSSVVAYRNKRKDLYRSLGLNSMQGSKWWDLRVAAEAHLGNKTQVEVYGPVIKQISTEFLDRIHSLRNYSNEVVTFMEEIHKWALESLSLIAMNRRLGCLQTLSRDTDAMILINSLKAQLDCMSTMESNAGSLGLWKHIPHPVWWKYCTAADEFSRIAFEYISRTMMLAVGKENGKAFLERMVHDENLKFKDVEVLCVDMLFEGLFTTTSAATFLLYNLATNPDKQQKLYEEVMTFLTEGGPNPPPPSFERIPYLGKCFREAMRLHPVSRGVVRTFEIPMYLSGYLVPANVPILAISQVIGRMEKYFRNAHSFVPERWGNEKLIEKRGYICRPFGYGKRSCLGKHIAELQISTLIVEMLKRYKVEYDYKSFEIETKLINLPVDPVIFKFTRR